MPSSSYWVLRLAIVVQAGKHSEKDKSFEKMGLRYIRDRLCSILILMSVFFVMSL